MLRNRQQSARAARPARPSRRRSARRSSGESLHHVLLVLALLQMLGLSACGGAGGAGGKLVTQEQLVDQLTIALEAPEKSPLLAEQDLLIVLNDQACHPIDGAHVKQTQKKPTMQHSPNEPDAVAAGPGRYKASALFTMVGTWNVEIHATVRGQEYIAIFHEPVA